MSTSWRFNHQDLPAEHWVSKVSAQSRRLGTPSDYHLGMGGIRSTCTSCAAVQTKAPGWVCDHFGAVLNMVSASRLGASEHFGPLLPVVISSFQNSKKRAQRKTGDQPTWWEQRYKVG